MVVILEEKTLHFLNVLAALGTLDLSSALLVATILTKAHVSGALDTVGNMTTWQRGADSLVFVTDDAHATISLVVFGIAAEIFRSWGLDRV